MSTPPALPNEPSSASSAADAPPPSRWEALLARLRPLARQSWLNCKVWIPFLLNPGERTRQVTYHAREHREGFTWQIHLPAQCWRCGRQAELRNRQLEIDLRGFEYPVSILGAAMGSAAFFWILALLLRRVSLAFVGLMALVVAAAVLYAKSWIETVKIDIATCLDDADALPFPGMVVHENELHLFLPNQRLAEATRLALKAERLGRDRGLPGVPRGTESDVEPAAVRDRYQSPFGTAPPRTVDLPPIKLAGDDSGDGEEEPK